MSNETGHYDIVVKLRDNEKEIGGRKINQKNLAAENTKGKKIKQMIFLRGGRAAADEPIASAAAVRLRARRRNRWLPPEQHSERSTAPPIGGGWGGGIKMR